MYEDVKTLELDDTTRVVVYYDETAEKPDWGNESDFPVFYIEYLGWYKCVPLNGSAEEYEDNINHALSAWGRDENMLERYLKAFFGASKLDWSGVDRGQDVYSFDPAEKVEAWGLSLDDSEKRSKALDDTVETWGAWGRGEVYTLSLEKLRTGKLHWDGSDDVTDISEWEQVETVGGYYGDREITDEMLTAFARETDV